MATSLMNTLTWYLRNRPESPAPAGLGCALQNRTILAQRLAQKPRCWWWTIFKHRQAAREQAVSQFVQ
jgi:hypothetical protein